MKIFHHRINEFNRLISIPSDDGVEIDLRSMDGRIVLQHEPFVEGEDFISWLGYWNGQDIILNVKEEGLESRILEILDHYRIENYFFLDQSFPFMVKTLKSGNKNVAGRVSDLESIETVLRLDCNWVWLDCFFGDWDFLIDAVSVLHSQGKRLCLVSPELVRAEFKSELHDLQALIKMNQLHLDAVCTKVKSRWEHHES